MKDQSRREFLKLAGVSTAIGSLPFSDVFAAELGMTARGSVPFDFGIASYTFRSFSLDQAIEMTKRLDIKRMTLKDMHLPMKSTDEEIKAALGKMKNAGVELSSLGVVYMKTEDEVHKAFAYAHMAGIKMMVGVPDAPLLELAEKKVKETDISLAIHTKTVRSLELSRSRATAAPAFHECSGNRIFQDPAAVRIDQVYVARSVYGNVPDPLPVAIGAVAGGPPLA